MHILILIGFIFLLIFIYGLFSEKLGKYSISGPMVFTIFGLITGSMFDLDQFHINSQNLIVVGEIALIAILFTDASNISLSDFFKVYKLPVRLLFIGLPITMALGTFAAIPLFGGFEIVALAMMAFILSPTDAALGQAVVNSPNVPVRIRETISVESGLNDGLVLPPILICAQILKGGSQELEMSVLLEFFGKQLIFAALIGIVLGWLGTRLINWSVEKKYSSNLYQGLSIIAIPIIAYVVSDHFGGNGFIAAFIAGLVFSPKSERVSNTGKEFGEVISQPLTLFVFFIFGSSIFPHFKEHFNLNVIIYAFLSLTILRMIPVLFSLRTLKIKRYKKVFIAWFGPRGIGSILYLLIVFQMIGDTKVYDELYAVIVLTVMFSIFAHGLSAVPYANWMGKKVSEDQSEETQ